MEQRGVRRRYVPSHTVRLRGPPTLSIMLRALRNSPTTPIRLDEQSSRPQPRWPQLRRQLVDGPGPPRPPKKCGHLRGTSLGEGRITICERVGLFLSNLRDSSSDHFTSSKSGSLKVLSK